MLFITDGTLLINLLADGESGIHLREWIPAVAGLKAGGYWRDSPFGSGRRLQDYQYDLTAETFELVVKGASQDQTIRMVQDLARMLNRARDYWATAWQQLPIYLVARAANETEARFALIHNYAIPQLDDPYAQPFLSHGYSALDQITLIVERGHWMSLPPGLGTCTPMVTEQEYHGIVMGQDGTGMCEDRYIITETLEYIRVNGGFLLQDYTEEKAFVANRHVQANISHVWYYDAGTGLFSVNLNDPANVGVQRLLLPFPCGPAESGSALYFGITASFTPYGPFDNIVVNIESPTSPLYTLAWGVWEYYNSLTATWVAPIVQDNTTAIANESFALDGRFSIHWDLANYPYFGEAVVNGELGYWVRYRITVAGGGSIGAIYQQPGYVYSILWPSVLIEEENAGGDIPPLAQVQVHVVSGPGAGAPTLYADRVFMGLRSVERGNEFSAYINFTATQPVPYNTVMLTGGPTAFVLAKEWCTNDCVVYTPGGVSAMAMEIYIFIENPLAQQYFGRYRVFMRYAQSGGAIGDILARLSVSAGGDTTEPLSWLSDIKSTETMNAFGIFDFGLMTIPGATIPRNNVGCPFYFGVELECTTVVATELRLYDLILIPVDEWAADCTSRITPTAPITSFLNLSKVNYLDLDSVTYPKNTLQCWGRRIIDDAIVTALIPVTSGEARFRENADQRLWFFFQKTILPTAPRVAPPGVAAYIQIYRSQRYLTMRGNR